MFNRSNKSLKIANRIGKYIFMSFKQNIILEMFNRSKKKKFKSHTEMVNIFLGHLNKILFQKCSTDLNNILPIFSKNLFSSSEFMLIPIIN